MRITNVPKLSNWYSKLSILWVPEKTVKSAMPEILNWVFYTFWIFNVIGDNTDVIVLKQTFDILMKEKISTFNHILGHMLQGKVC